MLGCAKDVRGKAVRTCPYCQQRQPTETPCFVCRAPFDSTAKPSRHNLTTPATADEWWCTKCQRRVTGLDIYALRKPGEDLLLAAERVFLERHGETCDDVKQWSDGHCVPAESNPWASIAAHVVQRYGVEDT